MQSSFIYVGSTFVSEALQNRQRFKETTKDFKLLMERKREKVFFSLIDTRLSPLTCRVDHTKLFFFTNKEFFCFSLVSLRFCYIQKKIIDSKMT